jgi:deoxycytidine triphosphate deaminase
MAYSGEDLFRNYRKTYVISPFQASQVSPLGYDLRVGHALTIKYSEDPNLKGDFASEMKLDEANNKAPISRPLKELIVGPNESVLIITVEQVYLSSKVLATVHAKASISVQGLFLNPVTVDPNFASNDAASGRIILFMKNVSGRNVVLKEKQGIATLIMHEVTTETLHLPEKSGFEDILRALSNTYAPDVISRISTYTAEHSGSRGLTEFARDRRAARNFRQNQHH